MKPITGKYRLVLVALLLLPPQAIAGDGGKDPTGQSLASASNPADTAAQAFSKTTYALIPLDAPASDGGTHEYRVSCITDDGEVDFTHYSSTDLGNPYSWQTERLLWWRGDIDAATFFPISGREYNPMNRAGQYTYLEFIPDSSGGENAGLKGMFVRRDGTESEIDFPKYDAEITTQVNEEQNFRLARNGGWSSVSISPLTAAIVHGFSIFPLEDGTSFSSIDESREYSRTRVHIPVSAGSHTDKILDFSEKWGHWGVNGATPALFDGALTIKERRWYLRSATMFSAGGMGQDAFCIVDETTAGPGGTWITTRKVRDMTGAVAVDLGEQGFKIQGGVPATSRNGHLAKRQTNGCIRYQYPSAEKEILPAAFGSGTGREDVQVNDVGDLLIQNAGSTDNPTSDMLVRKFTDPVTQEIVWAVRQFSDDTLPEGWSGLQIDALANAQPLAKQRELEALTPSAYPPRPEDTPAPMLGGIAMKDGKQHPVLLVAFEVVPDYNRDGMINDEDRNKVTVDNPFFFWINDDDDGNAEPHLGDIPGKQVDGEDLVVNSARDLLDFFPVQLRLKEMLTALPADKYTYKISHPTGAFHFIEMPSVQPDSSPEAQGAGSYLKNPTMADEAIARPMLDTTGQGAELTEEYLNAAKDGAGVLLFETKSATNQCFELIVSKKEGGAEVARVSRAMPVEMGNVESLIWQANIRPAASGQTPGAVVEPTNAKFKSTRKDQWFVFCHGYNVSIEDARGWNTDVFKRLYHEGSDARFVGVTWEGNKGQMDATLIFDKLLTPDYWLNVYNAFASSHALATTINGLTGSSKSKTVIAGHSLGNVLVSSALCDHELQAGQYFMFNSAVPREAYSATYVAQDRGNMRNPDWQNYPTRLWSPDWKDLYAANDGRHKLTWQGRFDEISTKTTPFNYYSTGEDVAASSVTGGKPSAITVLFKGSGAWVSQEMNKGLATKVVVSGLGTGNWLAGGGWDFNVNHYSAYRRNPLDPPGTPLPDTSAITTAQLQANPFFKPFTRLKVTNGGANPAADGIDITSAAGAAHASQYAVRAWMLAHEVPALTLPCASNSLGTIIDGKDMETTFKSGNWSGAKWIHSAMKDQDSTHVWKLYRNMCDKGDFRKP